MRRFRVGYILAFAALVFLFGPIALSDHFGGDSVCYGSTSAGRIEGAVRPPLSGENYRSYCDLCALALRTYGHEDAVGAVESAYAALAESHPGTEFMYGEIGFPWGGRIRPHRTHQNGLSFDFMAPLTDGRILPSSPFNRYGYDVEFDRNGEGPAGRIDFAAIAAHLRALDEAARERGGKIERVFFAPDLQDELFAAEGGAALRGRIAFNQTQSWVRHDDHYHVDFAFPCR